MLYRNMMASSLNETVVQEKQLSCIGIDGTGRLTILDTGGSSAAEGGMGTGGGQEEGAGIKDSGGKEKARERANEKAASEDKSWDPLKPDEEKEKGR